MKISLKQRAMSYEKSYEIRVVSYETYSSITDFESRSS